MDTVKMDAAYWNSNIEIEPGLSIPRRRARMLVIWVLLMDHVKKSHKLYTATINGLRQRTEEAQQRLAQRQTECAYQIILHVIAQFHLGIHPWMPSDDELRHLWLRRTDEYTPWMFGFPVHDREGAGANGL